MQEASLEEVMEGFEIADWLAAPVEPSIKQSTWLTAPKPILQTLQKVVGDRSPKIMDRAYAGSCTWLNGVYWVAPVPAVNNKVVVQNLSDVGRNKVSSVVAPVEREFLFPLLRGRDVQGWAAKLSAMILVPHTADDFGEPVALATMKQRYPQTFAYLKQFESQLKARSGYKQLHRSRPEFYVVGNVGNYALSPFKVVFKDLTEFFQCAVVGPQSVPGQAAPVPVIPDHTLLFLTCDSENEAHFVAGVLNSIPARVGMYCASVGVQTQRYFPTDVSRVKLPGFLASNAAHREIVRLSRSRHANAGQLGGTAISDDDLAIAEVCAEIWGIKASELSEVVSAYRQMQTLRRRQSNDGGDESDVED